MKPLHIAIAVLGLSCMASAQNLKGFVNDMNDKVSDAMRKKDINAFVKSIKPLVTSDFKYTEAGRTMNFDQMVANMKSGFQMFQQVTIVKAVVQKIEEKGDKGKTTSTNTMGGTIVGQDKKSHTMTMHGTSVETYVKVKGQWKLSSMTWSGTSMQMDGKTVDPNKMLAPGK